MSVASASPISALLFMIIRGLGLSDKCAIVRDNIGRIGPSVACLQETKLATDSAQVYRSFLPFNLDAFHACPAVGSWGGRLTAWSSSSFTLSRTSSSVYMTTVVLESTDFDFRVAFTNVYGPSDHSFTDSFLEDL